MFERLLKGVPWLAALGEMLFKHQFFMLQLGEALFIGGNHRAVACVNNSVKKLFYLLVESFDIALECFCGVRRLRKTRVGARGDAGSGRDV